MTTPTIRTSSAREQRVLSIALWLNVALAAALFVAGVIADSSGLIANALDNTSDAAVYTISYYAVSRGARWKTRAARVSGVMLIALSVGVPDRCGEAVHFRSGARRCGDRCDDGGRRHHKHPVPAAA